MKKFDARDSLLRRPIIRWMVLSFESKVDYLKLRRVLETYCRTLKQQGTRPSGS